MTQYFPMFSVNFVCGPLVDSHKKLVEIRVDQRLCYLLLGLEGIHETQDRIVG